jgi:hypothetical protein
VQEAVGWIFLFCGWPHTKKKKKKKKERKKERKPYLENN